MQCIVIEKPVLFNILCMHDAAEDVCVQPAVLHFIPQVNFTHKPDN